MKLKQLLTLVLLAVYQPIMAQQYESDVTSVDNIIKVLYEVISGEAGEQRNWDRFRNLFAENARLIPTSKNNEGDFTYRSFTPNEYVTLFTERIKTGFFEQEIHRTSEAYGTIVHVWSTYATQLTRNGENTNRGINSIQLLKTNNRYYIISIFWCAESLGFPLPDNYLK